MSRLEQIRDRLEAITAALRDEGTTDPQAAELSAEAATLTEEAAREAAAAVERLEQS